MKKIFAKEVTPGTILSEDVVKNSIILLSKGSVLTAKDINQLIKNNVKEIFVYDENDFEATSDIKVEFKEIPPVVEAKKYKKWTEQFEIVKDITKLEKDSTELNTVVEDIYKSFVKKEDVVLNLFHSISNENLSSHSINTAIISTIISVHLKMPYIFTFQLLKASLLHDIGYSFLSERVILDFENLDNQIVRSHVISGYKVFQSLKKEISKEAVESILYHHERYDGKGIIMGLKAERINPLVRILQIGDAYDSLIETSKSPYEAMSYLLSQAGKMFDPFYVSTFFSIVGLYPTGTQVILNNGKNAVVTKKGKAAVFPVVSVEGQIVETGPETGIFIKEVFKS
jgi:HD-GYP domain-containing protein (c-di-GMP phosphodiesterase class II)